MDCPNRFCCCNGSATATIAQAISIYLSENLTIEEAAIIGNLAVMIGDSMLAIAAINEVCCPSEESIISPAVLQ